MNQIEEIAYYSSPVGVIKIAADEKGITQIDFLREKKRVNFSDISNLSNKHLRNCLIQLDDYFKGERKSFNLKLNLKGTEFQKKVWYELIKIPFGKIISYGEVARRIKNEKAVRAVGQAIGKNPISIVIPCHRVIGSDGSLTGYASGLDIKKWLLEHEGVLGGEGNEL